MSFNFTPKTEEELMFANLLPEGEYAFRVKHAEEKISQAGNAMIRMILTMLDKDNRERNVYDNLINLETMLFKLRHFCYATGLETRYELGNLAAEDCIGKTGVCRIGIKEDKKKEFPPQNIVLDYVKADTTAKPGSALTDDDIPF